MNNNRQLIKSFFKSRSISGPSAALVNHQLGSFNDFLPHEKNSAPWMQRVVDNISIEVKVNKLKEKKFIYTPTEKYDKLKKLNPNIETLRKEFKLNL